MGVQFAEIQTLLSAVQTTGAGSVTLPVTGLASVGFQVVISNSATVTFQGTIDNTNWVSLQASSVASGAVAATATASGVYVAPCAGLAQVRANVTVYGSGTVTVKALGTVVAGAGQSPLGVVRNEQYTTIATGCVAGSTGGTQFASVACKLVRIKAHPDNAGNVYVGISGVTVSGTAGSTTGGFILDAGDDTGWIPTDNLNRFYYIGDNTGDDMTYMALA